MTSSESSHYGDEDHSFIASSDTDIDTYSSTESDDSHVQHTTTVTTPGHQIHDDHIHLPEHNHTVTNINASDDEDVIIVDEHISLVDAEETTNHNNNQPSTSAATYLPTTSSINISSQSSDFDLIPNKSRKRQIKIDDSPDFEGDSKSIKIEQAPPVFEDTCPICFELWTSQGDHRICTLKCGHLFGKSCIDKWIRSNKPSCPQCNKKARKCDIINLYAQNVKVEDNSETERIKAELAEERLKRLSVENELHDHRVQLNWLKSEAVKLNKQLNFYKNNANSDFTIDLTENGSNIHSDVYSKEGSLVISENGQCRVLALSTNMNILLASQPSINPLFKGYGVRKIDLVEFRNSTYLHLHSMTLRDLAVSKDGNMLISVGIDRRIKLTSLMSEQNMFSAETEAAVWSCAWSAKSPNNFFVGLVNGKVVQYDIRQTLGPISTLENPFSTTATSPPVISLQPLAADIANNKPAGLLVGQLDRCLYYEHSNNDDETLSANSLPSEGQLAWLSAEQHTRHILMTYRPSTNQNRSTVVHVVSELSNSSTLNPLTTIKAGLSMKFLTRSRIFQDPINTNLIRLASGDEGSQTVKLWDAMSGSLVQNLPRVKSPVVDLIPIKKGKFLAAITDQSVHMYRHSSAQHADSNS